jgi:tripartite-type tricarboxylate transporter receptor subunit TctC
MKNKTLAVSISTILIALSTLVSAKETISIAWPFGPVAAHMPYRVMSENANSAQNDFAFVIDFKSGAGGAIAAQHVLANPNTVLSSSSAFYVAAETAKSYDINAFRLIDTLCDLPMVIASTKFKSMKDLPRDSTPVKIGHNGVGSTTHLLLLALQKQNLNIIAVPYQGSKQAITDLIGGHIDAIIGLPGDTFSLADGGKLNIIAVSGSNSLKGVPTLAAQGFAGTEKIIVQYYLHAKKDDANAEKISSLLRVSLHQPNVKKVLEDNMCLPRTTAVKDLDSTHRSLGEYWKQQVNNLPKNK